MVDDTCVILCQMGFLGSHVDLCHASLSQSSLRPSSQTLPEDKYNNFVMYRRPFYFHQKVTTERAPKSC